MIKELAEDAELITQLMLLEEQMGEHLKAETLSDYLAPQHLVRVIKLLPWRFNEPVS
jgi:hypothetical protein